MLSENLNRLNQIIRDKENKINQLRNDIENLSEIIWKEEQNQRPSERIY